MAKNNSVSLDIITDELAPVSSISPNDYNPNRQNSDEFYLLVKSIAEDGFTDAVIVNRADRRIIDGEHRWTAAIVLHHMIKNNLTLSRKNTDELRGRREEILDPDLKIPIKLLDKDEIQRRISTQRHNKARGHDDIELAAQMFKELEAMGGLEAAVAGLDMSDEEMDRLLSYGDSILDTFPGEEPSLAWEPRQTLPGEVASWEDPENNQTQSVSRAASKPAEVVRVENDVPGLRADNFAPPAGDTPAVGPSRMARRIYIFLEDEAKIVDKVLGPEGASKLVEICRKLLSEASND